MFITFEGVEGAGKSTAILEVKKLLVNDGLDVVVVHDPGGTQLSYKIRELIKHDPTLDICSVAQLFLFSAARAQLVSEVIAPALAEGKIVLCDRFADSTIVYQGMMNGIADNNFVRMINFASQNITPDRTYLLDLPAEKGLLRVYSRSDAKPDRFDSMPVDFHKEIRICYLMLAERYKKRVVVVDADRDIVDVVSDVYSNISKFLTRRRDRE